VGFYLLLTYLEHGADGFFPNLSREDMLEQSLVFLLIPIFVFLGYVMEKRSRFLEMYSENLEKAVDERTSELLETIDRHESYIFSVADGLRNPLQVFLGNLETIDTSNFTPEQKRAHQNIRAAAELLQENITLLTERVGIERAEMRIRESEKKERLFQNFVENSNDAMYMVDLKGNFIYVNRTAEQLLGYPKEEIIGKNISEFLHPEWRGEAFMRIAKLLAGERLGTHEMVVKTAYGDRIGEMTASLLMDGLKPVGVLGIARDITERKKVQENLAESEQMFRAIFDNAMDGILLLDVARERFFTANNRFLEMLGYTLEELESLDIMDIHPEGEREFVRGEFERLVRGEITLARDIPILRKDGSVFYAEVNSSPITLVGKEYLVQVYRDITERKEVQEALAESEKAYRNLVDNALVGVYRTTLTGEFLYVNEALCRMFGYDSPEEFLAGNVSARYKNEADREVFLKDLRERGFLRNHEMEYLTKDGSVIHVLENATMEGETISGMVMDITKRKEAEETLKKYFHQLEESNRLRRLFNDILSHDLYNPLGVVESYIELLKDKVSGEEEAVYLEAMEDSLKRAREILDDANAYIKLRETNELDYERLGLASVIGYVLDDLEEQIAEGGFKLKFDYQGDPEVIASPLIKTVFSNLISNSIKYCPAGSTLEIEIEDGDPVRVRIKDRGPGIPDKDKENIFNRYERMKKAGVQGVGLGLAIVKRIVELHHGRVWVEDNPGGGSIFVVELPKEGP